MSSGTVANGIAVQQVSVLYRPHRERPRVAVLIDNAVASSGEAVVIAWSKLLSLNGVPSAGGPVRSGGPAPAGRQRTVNVGSPVCVFLLKTSKITTAPSARWYTIRHT